MASGRSIGPSQLLLLLVCQELNVAFDLLNVDALLVEGAHFPIGINEELAEVGGDRLSVEQLYVIEH